MKLNLLYYVFQRYASAYNREDLWDFPLETYDGSQQTMEPYYMVTRLPGEEKESFLDRDNRLAIPKKKSVHYLF